MAQQSSKVRRPTKWTNSTLEAGMVYGYRWQADRTVPLWVVDLDDRGRYTEPVVQVLDWVGPDADALDVRALRVKEHPFPQRLVDPSLWDRFHGRDDARSFHLVRGEAADRSEEALVPLGKRPVSPIRRLRPKRTNTVVRWDSLPAYHEKLFGVSTSEP